MSVSTSKAKARSFRFTLNEFDEDYLTDIRRIGLLNNRRKLFIVSIKLIIQTWTSLVHPRPTRFLTRMNYNRICYKGISNIHVAYVPNSRSKMWIYKGWRFLGCYAAGTGRYVLTIGTNLLPLSSGAKQSKGTLLSDDETTRIPQNLGNCLPVYTW
jgi:hypothetical protein